VMRAMDRYLNEIAARGRAEPPGKYTRRGAVSYEPVDVDPPAEQYEREVAEAFERAGQ
jgi:hypothetical protein